MKKTYSTFFSPIEITLFFGLFLAFNSILTTNANANKNPIVERILELGEAAFDNAITDEEKFEIVSMPFSSQYTFGKQKLHNDFNIFKRHEHYNHNLLALAVAQADLNRTKKFLNLVLDINDEKFNIWLDRHYVNLAYVALRHESLKCNNVDLYNRCEIIKLLGNNFIDFTYRQNLDNLSAIILPSALDDLPKHKINLIVAAILNGADISKFSESSYLEAFTNPNTTYFSHFLHYAKLNGRQNMHPKTKKIFKNAFDKFLS